MQVPAALLSTTGGRWVLKTPPKEVMSGRAKWGRQIHQIELHLKKLRENPQGKQAEIIKLYGSMELAPLMGLADEIVDIVDTGKTLAENGMAPRELIADISSRLIVNKASMRTRHASVQTLVEALTAAVKTEGQ